MALGFWAATCALASSAPESRRSALAGKSAVCPTPTPWPIISPRIDPTVIMHLAAVCGGIGANQARPAEMIHDNLLMACHVVRAASENSHVKKLVLVGSVCGYPKFTPTPFREEDLWNGYPEETNAPYGIAKRALFELAGAYHRQYGLHAACLLPANLYGPGDSFDDAKSHVIPAIIRKFVEAQESGAPSVTLWGTGAASRDFLYVKDCADAIIAAAERLDTPDPINIGTGREVRIAQLAETIADVVGYRGELVWDTSKPDGQPRRCLDVSRARAAGVECRHGPGRWTA